MPKVLRLQPQEALRARFNLIALARLRLKRGLTDEECLKFLYVEKCL